MAVYFVTGKLGSGKSLACVDKIREYLSVGRRVATNLDLHLDGMFQECKNSAIRLPDKPRPEDMHSLGEGYEAEDPRDYDESKFGLIVLDECGTWLNSREWNDKERRKLIDWFLHARKLRWDVMFLIQSIDSCDGQIVASLCEHLVVCRRMDRFKLAGIKLPRMHIANVYYGRTTEVRVERWTYRGTDLFDAYDTRQVFKDDVMYTDIGPVDMRAPYTMLSAWHLKARYAQPEAEKPSLWRRLAVLSMLPVLVPIFWFWQRRDPAGYYKTVFRKQYLEQQADRLRAVRAHRKELLRIALDPANYPPISSLFSSSDSNGHVRP